MSPVHPIACRSRDWLRHRRPSARRSQAKRSPPRYPIRSCPDASSGHIFLATPDHGARDRRTANTVAANFLHYFFLVRVNRLRGGDIYQRIQSLRANTADVLPVADLQRPLTRRQPKLVTTKKGR